MRSRQRLRPNPERGFYVVASFVFLALVFWVFARSYYLKLLFATPALPVLLHVHGAVMSGWVVLLRCSRASSPHTA